MPIQHNFGNLVSNILHMWLHHLSLLCLCDLIETVYILTNLLSVWCCQSWFQCTILQPHCRDVCCLTLSELALIWEFLLQFAFNTLQRVTPVSHGVCNVVKRVVIIGTSVVFFGNKLTMKTKLGTAIALLGTYLYTEATKRTKKQAPQKPFPTTGTELKGGSTAWGSCNTSSSCTVAMMNASCQFACLWFWFAYAGLHSELRILSSTCLVYCVFCLSVTSVTLKVIDRLRLQWLNNHIRCHKDVKYSTDWHEEPVLHRCLDLE